jgi:hypothetical protein
MCIPVELFIFAFVIVVITATIASMGIDRLIEKYAPKKKKGKK